MTKTPDEDDEALKELERLRRDLDAARTRLKQVPHPATLKDGGRKPRPAKGGRLADDQKPRT